MTSTSTPDAFDIPALAQAADLPLTPERQAAAAAILAAWLPAANALSRKMSASEHHFLMPVTTFSHPSEPSREQA